jgi:LmbE family N-acetylglucosaminyl deacetylase
MPESNIDNNSRNDHVADDGPRRAMFVVAHADDIEFTCAGTAARWVREGFEVTYVICTDSSKGSEDPTITREQLAAMRVEEQRAAAAAIGVDDVVFLPYEDGHLADGDRLRRDLVRLIRQRRPDKLVGFDPTTRWVGQEYINHPDHIAVGNATLFAVYPLARNRPTFPELLAEGLEPHTVKELYLFATDKADTWVDIGETLDLKIAALRHHASQLGDRDPADMIRQWARDQGTGHDVEYAEAFKYFKLD